MQKYSDVVLDKNGKGIAGATVTVTTYPDSQSATIYAADGGPAVNSVTTDSAGRFSFYAANGHYSITVSGQGITPYTYNDVTLFDPLDNADASIKFTPAGAGAIARTVRDRLRDVVSVKDFGAKGDGVTDDTAAIQAAIDYAYTKYSVVSGYARGAPTVFMPAGAYKFTQIVRKNGVSLRGEGRYKTVLLMSQDGGKGFRCAASTSQLAADGVYYLDDADFALIPNPAITFNAATILWDMTGFTRCTWRNIALAFKTNVTAVSMKGATTAGAGGPAQWYNSFYDVFTEGETGGIGWDLGDTDATKEQVTTWNWYGGRTASGNATGIGMRLNSATGCNLYGHCFEGLADQLIIGSAAGTRGCSRVNLFGCYFEGSVRGYTIYPNAVGTYLAQYFATGVTNADNGTRTMRLAEAETSLPVSNVANSFKLVQANGSVKPKVTGSTSPGMQFENSGGARVELACNAATSSANAYYEISNDLGHSLIKGGEASTTLYQSSLYLANQSTVGIFYDPGTPTFGAANGSICISPNGFYVRAAGAWVAK